MLLYNPVSTLAASLCSLYTDSVRDRPSSPPPPLCRTRPDITSGLKRLGHRIMNMTPRCWGARQGGQLRRETSEDSAAAGQYPNEN